MPLVLTTDPDSPYSVELAGVGTLGGSARGGILAERAADVFPEFQDKDGEPLSGKQLEEAVRDFAKDRGLRVRSVKTVDEEALRVEGGAFPAGPTIEQVSREATERTLAQVHAHAEEPDAPPLTTADLPPQATAENPTPEKPKEG